MAISSEIKRLVKKEEYLLKQFTNTLRVQLDRLDPDKNSDAHELLKEEPSWHNAYQLELKLVELYNPVELEVVWQKYLADINVLSDDKQAFFSSKANPDTAQLPELCRQVIKELQWHWETERVKRHYSARLQRNVVLVFLFSFVAFFFPTISKALFNFEFESLRMYYIFTAASAGLLGAAFSQVTSLAGNIRGGSMEQLRGIANLFYVVTRTLMGAGAGLIMFYILQSGLVETPVQPKFIQDTAELEDAINDLSYAYQQNNKLSLAMGWEATEEPMSSSQSNSSQLNAASNDVENRGSATIHKIENDLQLGALARPSLDLSLLIVWCLIAGFFEKLIPDLLVKSSRVGKDKEKE